MTILLILALTGGMVGAVPSCQTDTDSASCSQGSPTSSLMQQNQLRQQLDEAVEDDASSVNEQVEVAEDADDTVAEEEDHAAESMDDDVDVVEESVQDDERVMDLASDTCFDKVTKTLEADQDHWKKKFTDGMNGAKGGHWMLWYIRNWSAQANPNKDALQSRYLPEYVDGLLKGCGAGDHRRRGALAKKFANHGAGALYIDSSVSCWRADYVSDNKAHDFQVQKNVKGKSKTCQISTKKGVDEADSCGSVQTLKLSQPYWDKVGFEIKYCKNWKWKKKIDGKWVSKSRPLAIGGDSAAFRSTTRIKDGDKGSYQLKLGHALLKISAPDGINQMKSALDKNWAWLKDNVDKILLENGIKFTVDFTKVAAWGYSAGGNDASKLALGASTEVRNAIKGVVAFGGWNTPEQFSKKKFADWKKGIDNSWMPGMFSLWCNEGPGGRRPPPYDPKPPQRGDMWEWVDAGSPVVVHYEYSDCNHGQYKNHDEDWFQQLKDYMNKIFS